MEICIRNARLEDYQAVETIMKQVQQLHIHWRPDIYKYSEPVLAAGILFIILRHIESPNQVTRDVLFVDSMAVDEKYRGKGIGHAFFDFLQDLKKQKGYDAIELQVNAKNTAAYKMYCNYGFTSKSIHMELL